jgi:hypothetical protein
MLMFKPSDIPDQVSQQKRQRVAMLTSDVKVPLEEQTPEVQKLFETHKFEFQKVLRIDRGVSKADNWSYSLEDKVRYFIIPLNSNELASKSGWRSFYALMFESGIRMKISSTPFEISDIPSEVDDFMAGLANRVKQLPELRAGATLRITGSTAFERGRSACDLLILKKFSGAMGVDKFLPASVLIGGKTFLKHYISLLGGSAGIACIKNVPDVINTLITSEAERNSKLFSRLAENYRIPFNVVIDDLIRKRTREVVVNRKTVKQTYSVNYSKISGSPFTLNIDEDDFFRTQETAWEKASELTEVYKLGVPLNKLTEVREEYTKICSSKQRYIETYSPLKSRRLEAFKALAAISRTNKEMEAWRLSKNSVQDALDNFPAMYLEARRSKDWTTFKKVITSLHPKHIVGYQQDETWNAFTLDQVKKAFGDIPYTLEHDSAQAIKDAFETMISFSNEMTMIRSTVAKPTPPKGGKVTKRTSGPSSDLSEEDSEDMSLDQG